MSPDALLHRYAQHCAAFRVPKENSAVLAATATAAETGVLDLRGVHLGWKGHLAVTALVMDHPALHTLDLSATAWFPPGDQGGPVGDAVLRVLCLALAAHPGLRVLRLCDIPFATAAYVQLVRLARSAPALETIDTRGTLLLPHHVELIAATLSRGKKPCDTRPLAVVDIVAKEAVLAEASLGRAAALPSSTLLQTAEHATVVAALEACGGLALLPGDALAALAATATSVCFAVGDALVEEDDEPDAAYLVTEGIVVQRCGEEAAHPTVEYPPGSLVAVDELLVGQRRRATLTAAHATSWYASLADAVVAEAPRGDLAMRPRLEPAPVSAVVNNGGAAVKAYRLSVEALRASGALAAISNHRAHWERAIDGFPSLHSLGEGGKWLLADSVREVVAPAGVVVAAGRAMLGRCLLVVEGAPSVFFQSTELRRLTRGEIFLCHPGTDAARSSFVAGDRLARFAEVQGKFYLTLPRHIQRLLARQASLFSMAFTADSDEGM